MAHLEMHYIVVSFGGNRALDHISMEVDSGIITGLRYDPVYCRAEVDLDYLRIE